MIYGLHLPLKWIENSKSNLNPPFLFLLYWPKPLSSISEPYIDFMYFVLFGYGQNIIDLFMRYILSLVYATFLC